MHFYQKLNENLQTEQLIFTCINYILLLNGIFFSVFFQCSYLTVVVSMLMVCVYNFRSVHYIQGRIQGARSL